MDLKIQNMDNINMDLVKDLNIMDREIISRDR